MVSTTRLVLPKNYNDLFLEGQRFERLFVLRQGLSNLRKDRYGLFKTLTWYCLCDCGKSLTVCHYKLKSGHTKSCGCLSVDTCRKNFKKHGLRNTKEYSSWSGMKKRCYNKNDKRYPDWGGRGIKVCERWLNSFENFYQDMGICPPEKKSLDRIDNNGNYEPSNCRWATIKEQNINRRPKRKSKPNNKETK